MKSEEWLSALRVGSLLFLWAGIVIGMAIGYLLWGERR